MPKITKQDRAAIRDLARQDMAGETDDYYARTLDAPTTISRWRESGAQAGDRELVELIDRVTPPEAARLYEECRLVVASHLFWDRQDPQNPGWVLRYLERGEEHCSSVAGAIDDGLETLAAAVVVAVPHLTSEVRVYRRDRQVGSLTVEDGEVKNWRAV